MSKWTLADRSSPVATVQTVCAGILEVAYFHAGPADGNFPATHGSAQGGRFTGPRTHRQIPDAGHDLSQETPTPWPARPWNWQGLRTQERKE